MREEDVQDLEEMVSLGCLLPIRGEGLASVAGKVNCLLQVCFRVSPAIGSKDFGSPGVHIYR